MSGSELMKRITRNPISVMSLCLAGAGVRNPQEAQDWSVDAGFFQ